MKKNHPLIILFTFLILLTSCYTYTTIPISETMDSWLGHSEHDIIMQFGSPTNTNSDGAGGKILRYSESTSSTLFYNPYNTNVIVSKSRTNVSYMEFYINNNGTVYSWRTNYPDQKQKNKKENKKFIAAILSFPVPFGILGLHRIYLGTKPYMPFVYLGTIGGSIGILPLIDFITILSSDKETLKRFENNPGVFMWSH